MQCYKNGWTDTLPEVINVSQDQLVPAQVRHEYVHCAPELRRACLAYLLRTELSGGADAGQDQAIVFAHSVEAAEALHAWMRGTAPVRGDGTPIAVNMLHEGMSLDARAAAVTALR